MARGASVSASDLRTRREPTTAAAAAALSLRARLDARLLGTATWRPTGLGLGRNVGQIDRKPLLQMIDDR